MRPPLGAFFPAILLFSLTLTWRRASWSAGTTRLRYVRIDRPVFMCGGAFELSPPRLAPAPRVLLATVHRSGLGLLRCTGYPGVPFCSFSIFCLICTCLCTVTGIFVVLYVFASLALIFRIDKDISHSCCSTVSAQLECCELGFASHLIDLLLDDRFFLCTVFFMILDFSIFIMWTSCWSCWSCMPTTCSTVRCWILS